MILGVDLVAQVKGQSAAKRRMRMIGLLNCPGAAIAAPSG